MIHSGSGTIFLVDSSPGGMIVVKRFEWNDALFDVTWSENNEHVCVTGSGDGSIQVWDFAQQQVSQIINVYNTRSSRSAHSSVHHMYL